MHDSVGPRLINYTRVVHACCTHVTHISHVLHVCYTHFTHVTCVLHVCRTLVACVCLLSCRWWVQYMYIQYSEEEERVYLCSVQLLRIALSCSHVYLYKLLITLHTLARKRYICTSCYIHVCNKHTFPPQLSGFQHAKCLGPHETFGGHTVAPTSVEVWQAPEVGTYCALHT